MGMPGRLHGKAVPLAPGKTETCPYCFRQYKYVTVIEERGKTIKLCPFCREVLSGFEGLQARVKSAITRASSDAKTKSKPTARKVDTRTKPKKK
jgi:hypothetical protein